MTRTRSILGAILLSALAVCAFGASSASALTAHECLPAPAVGGTGVLYSDAECKTPNVNGTFETAKISGKKAVENTLTPTTAGMNVTTGETAGTHIVLHTVLGGISVQITCTGASSPGAEIENGESGGVMTVTGEGKAKYTGCELSGGGKAPENCQVPATLETVTLSMTSEADKLVFKPKVGGTFITIPFTSKAGKTCPAAILGEKEITGVARGSAAAPTALELTSESGSELKLGGIAAQITAVTHIATAGGGNTIAIETP